MISDLFEPIIGLEVHVHLLTKTKAFCGCSAQFGATPNSHTCPVCLGFPGSLPVLNKEAFKKALLVALALNCKVQKSVKFDRKNYYYPDLPKNFQISQFDKPIAYEGSLSLFADPERKIKIRRVHLEEDAGKLLHDQDAKSTVIDYNRSGIPLLEIVTEPDIHSPEEAHDYLSTLKAVLLYLGVSDCNMEEGSLRCDANISIRPKGEDTLGVKSELKNMNSFKAVRQALEYEINRHMDAVDAKETIFQETRLWDQNNGKTYVMRTKEESHDYRYFPEPDLVPFIIDQGDVDEAARNIPELPHSRKNRFLKEYSLNEKTVNIIIADINTAIYFERAVQAGSEALAAANWITGDIMSELNSKKISISEYGLKPEWLAELLSFVKNGTISGKMAKDILKESAEKNKPPKDIISQNGAEQISDESELSSIISGVIKENQKSVNDYRQGKTAALTFLVGQVMKKTKGKANPQAVNKLLIEELGK